MMTLDMDDRIQAAMQRQAEREAARKAEEEAAKQAAWREACQKSEAYYAPLWEGDLTPDLVPVLRIGWMDSGRNSVPLRFSANLDGTRVAVEWLPSASWHRTEDDALSGQWRLAYALGGPIGNVERGELADTLLTMLGRIRQERAEETARKAKQEEERRANEAYWAEQRRLREEHEAQEKATVRARFQALAEEDATARPLLEEAVNALRFQWPPDTRLTLYRARWCGGWTYGDEDEGAAVADYTTVWGLSDRPDADGYYFFKGENKHINPPRETLTWERYEVDSLDTLPAALCQTFTVSVPGFDIERVYNPDSNQHAPAEFVVRREGSRLERRAGQRPVRWVREVLGIPDPPPDPVEPTEAEDEWPF